MHRQVKRKSKGPNFRVQVGSSFPETFYREIERLAKDFQIGKAEVVRALCLKGLDAYRIDGVLTDENNIELVKAWRRLHLITTDGQSENLTSPPTN